MTANVNRYTIIPQTQGNHAMSNQTFKTSLPFVGFYQSMFETLIDDELELMIDWMDDEPKRKLREMFYQDGGIDYGKAFNEIAKDYAEWLLINLSTYLKHSGFKVSNLPDDFGFILASPKSYNFETDNIWVTLPVDFLPSPVEFDNKHQEYGMIAMLDESIRENYTSYDGFISLVPNEVTDELLDGKFDKTNPYHTADYVCLLCDYYFADPHDDTNLVSRLTYLWLESVLGDGYFSELVSKHCKNWGDIKSLINKNFAETEHDDD